MGVREVVRSLSRDPDRGSSSTLTSHLLCLQPTMAKQLQARRLDGIAYNPW